MGEEDRRHGSEVEGEGGGGRQVEEEDSRDGGDYTLEVTCDKNQLD